MKAITDYQISDEAKNLTNLAQEVLDTVVGIYAQANVPLPSRQYWMVGQPAEDCEQVVVSLLQLYLGTPGDQAVTPQNCNEPRSAVFNISITRTTAVPQKGTSNPPLPASIITAAMWSATDLWLLIDNNKQFDKFDTLGGPGLGVIITGTGATPEGGLQTVNVNLTVAVP